MQLRSPSITTALDSQSKRDAVPETMLTCGYLNGDPAQGWLAPSGYDCRVDTAHGIWGFCPTTVVAATDCGLGGYCFDANTCTSGCGSLSNNPVITTWTCTPSDPESRYCSMAFLTFGVDQTYEYFHCGPEPSTAHYLAIPTAALTISKTTTCTSASSTLRPPTMVSLPPTAIPASSLTLTPPSTLSTGQLISLDHVSVSTLWATDPNASPSSGTDERSNTGAIIGGVIGGLALICGFAGIVIYLRMRARMAKAGSQQQILSTLEPSPPLCGRYQGGWGPSELSSHEYHVRFPVELPTNSFG